MTKTATQDTIHRNLTRTIAVLISEARAAGATPDVIADLWALRAMPVQQQLERLPEWMQVRAEWHEASALAH